MESKLYNKTGEVTTDPKEAIAALFEGSGSVEIMEMGDPPVQTGSIMQWDMFMPVRGDNNLSIYFDPVNKVFSAIGRDDDGELGTSISFIEEDYDRFMELMRLLLECDK